MTWMLLGWALAQTTPTPAPAAPAPAAAAPAVPVPPKPEKPRPMVVGRAIAEAWSDPAIGTVYASGGILSGLGAVIPITRTIGVDVEVGYRRLHTDEGAAETDDTFLLEVLPISGLAEFTLASKTSALDGFVGVGPSFAGFREHHPPNAEGFGITRGAKLSLELRAGLRIDTGLVQPRMAPGSPVRGLDVELYGARRFQVPGGKGFDLDAWRGGLGLGVRL